MSFETVSSDVQMNTTVQIRYSGLWRHLIIGVDRNFSWKHEDGNNVLL